MRRILGVAFCYALALQAIFSAYSTALAVADGRNAALGFVICHAAADETPAGSDTGKHAAISCPMCAMAFSASGLPPGSASTIAAPTSNAHQVTYGDTDVAIASPLARAGLARAPPQLA
jgi:hypothetical protein